MAGNKTDLTNKRSVEFVEASQYAEENALLFLETSAKTAMNVDEIFLAIGEFQSIGSLITVILRILKEIYEEKFVVVRYVSCETVSEIFVEFKEGCEALFL